MEITDRKRLLFVRTRKPDWHPSIFRLSLDAPPARRSSDWFPVPKAPSWFTISGRASPHFILKQVPFFAIHLGARVMTKGLHLPQAAGNEDRQHASDRSRGLA